MNEGKPKCPSDNYYSTASSLAETTNISWNNSINSHRDTNFQNCVHNYGKF